MGSSRTMESKNPVLSTLTGHQGIAKSLACPICGQALSAIAGYWYCPTHERVDEGIARNGVKVKASIASAKLVADRQPVVKRCCRCHQEFETRNHRHRFCRLCLPS